MKAPKVKILKFSVGWRNKKISIVVERFTISILLLFFKNPLTTQQQQQQSMWYDEDIKCNSKRNNYNRIK